MPADRPTRRRIKRTSRPETSCERLGPGPVSKEGSEEALVRQTAPLGEVVVMAFDKASR